jgi:hypothetical protein
MSLPSEKKPKPHWHSTRKDKWITVTPKEASGQKSALSGRREVSDVNLKALTLTSEQISQINRIYEQGLAEDTAFQDLEEADQLRAASLLATHHLDVDSRDNLGSRWSVKWTRTSGGKQIGQSRRVLYQW